MDLLKFDALVSSMDRILSFQAYEGFWLDLMASQGSSKGIKETMKSLERKAFKRKPSLGEAPKDDQEAFKKRFGKGF